jgi:hypothetical protein
MYHKAADEIERKGGKILDVQLDYELKEKLYQRLGRALAKAWASSVFAGFYLDFEGKSEIAQNGCYRTAPWTR